MSLTLLLSISLALLGGHSEQEYSFQEYLIVVTLFVAVTISVVGSLIRCLELRTINNLALSIVVIGFSASISLKKLSVSTCYAFQPASDDTWVMFWYVSHGLSAIVTIFLITFDLPMSTMKAIHHCIAFVTWALSLLAMVVAIELLMATITFTDGTDNPVVLGTSNWSLGQVMAVVMLFPQLWDTASLIHVLRHKPRSSRVNDLEAGLQFYNLQDWTHLRWRESQHAAKTFDVTHNGPPVGLSCSHPADQSLERLKRSRSL